MRTAFHRMNFQFQPALPMRGVTLHGRCQRRGAVISTRTPHAGSDGLDVDVHFRVSEFQPALPMRGVTEQLYELKDKY